LIVSGELVAVTKDKSATSVLYNGARTVAYINHCTLLVHQVLKGDHANGMMMFDTAVPESFLGWTIPVQGTSGLFFLKLTENKEFTFTDSYHGYIHLAPNIFGGGTTPLERVTNIVGNTLTNSPDRDLGIEAIRYLESSKSSSATTALRAALNNPNIELQLSASSALFRRGDGSGLGIVKRTYLSGPGFGSEGFQEGIGNNMAYYLSDPKYVPELEELLLSPSVYMRRGASGSLRLTKSQAAIRGLLRAIDDSDFEVRYFAARGLAEITDQKKWIANELEFKAAEAEFKNHWRDWARAR
jgi:hypothetical protein